MTVAAPVLTVDACELATPIGTFKIASRLTLASGVYTLDDSANQPGFELLLFLGGLAAPLQQLVFGEQDFSAPQAAQFGATLNQVRLNGDSLAPLKDRERAQRVGFVFENPEWGFICNSVFEDVGFSFAALGQHAPPIYRLKAYGLYDAAQQKPETLSGGEQQRLACLPVMERSPPLCLMDFSSANVDQAFRAQFIEWTREASKNSIIIVRGWNEPPATFGAAQSISIAANGVVSIGQSQVVPVADQAAMLNAAFAGRTPAGDVLLHANKFAAPFSKAPIDMIVRPGDVVRLRGPNGSGKTTFLRAVVNRSLHKLGAHTGDLDVGRAAHPAISFQHPEHCSAAFELKTEVHDITLLALLNIDPRWLGTPSIHVPRSVRKLVSLAAVCEMSGSLVLWDEPTVSLDLDEKKSVIALINRFPDKAFVMATHDESLTGIGSQVELGAP